jgi:NADPH:quinone reductase
VAYDRSLGADRVIDYKTEDIGRAIRDWSAEGVDVVLDVVGSTTLPHALDMLRPGGRLVSILTVTADGDIERDRKEAEAQGFRKITRCRAPRRRRTAVLAKLPGWSVPSTTIVSEPHPKLKAYLLAPTAGVQTTLTIRMRCSPAEGPLPLGRF